MESILSFIGPLDETDISFLSDRETAAHFKQVELAESKIDFKDSFPYTNDDLRTVL